MEHVPPKCLFPESKDLPDGINFRSNLITVPSCDLHNSSKSKNDEYLLFVLLSHYENNLAAQRQFSRKAIRALKKRPSLHAFFRDRMPALVDGQETIAFVVDKQRLELSLAQIARGLHFHHFGDKWTEDMLVFCHALIPVHRGSSQVSNQLLQAHENFVEKSSRLFDGVFTDGDNPEIFNYQIRREINPESYAIRMLFYEGVEVIVASASPR